MSFTTLDDFLLRARRTLDPVEGKERLPEGGDIDMVDESSFESLRRAAVLIPVIPRPSGPSVLLTLRPDTMPTHPGQVAFPGGKVDPIDANEVAAALREAHEEVGVDPDKVDLIARCAPYFTGTGFRIVPVLGVLPADFVAVREIEEVEKVFEVPLSFLMDVSNHTPNTVDWRGRTRHFYEIAHGGNRIWGVTAGIIRALYDRLYGPQED